MMERGARFLQLMSGIAMVGAAMASGLRSMVGGVSGPQIRNTTATGRTRRSGMTVAAGQRAARKRRNVLRARGQHRKAVR